MTGDQVHDVWSHLRIISNIKRSGAIHKPRLSGRAGGTLLHLRSDVSVTFPQWSGGHPGFYFIIPSSFSTPWNSASLSSLSPGVYSIAFRRLPSLYICTSAMSIFSSSTRPSLLFFLPPGIFFHVCLRAALSFRLSPTLFFCLTCLRLWV